MVGLVNGAGVFKDDIHTGASYWTAIDGPLAYEPPTSTPPDFQWRTRIFHQYLLA